MKNTAVQGIPVLAYGDAVEIQGVRAFSRQSVGTLRGFYAKGWDNPEARLADSRRKGEKEVWFNALPIVIAAQPIKDKPLAAVLYPHQPVQIEGNYYTVELPRPGFCDGDSCRLVPIEPVAHTCVDQPSLRCPACIRAVTQLAQ